MAFNKHKMLLIAAHLLVTSLALCASARAAENDNNTKDIFVCAAQQDWVQHAAIQSYFRSRYYDFDLRSGAFIGSPGQRFSRFPSHIASEQIRLNQQYREDIDKLFERAGYLLPYLSGTTDAAPLLQQLAIGQIEHLPEEKNIQFLRVALTQNMLNSSENAAEVIINYVAAIQQIKQLASELEPGHYSQQQGEKLDALMQQAYEYHVAFRTLAKDAIFSADLQQQLSTQLAQYCTESQG